MVTSITLVGVVLCSNFPIEIWSGLGNTQNGWDATQQGPQEPQLGYGPYDVQVISTVKYRSFLWGWASEVLTANLARSSLVRHLGCLPHLTHLHFGSSTGDLTVQISNVSRALQMSKSWSDNRWMNHFQNSKNFLVLFSTPGALVVIPVRSVHSTPSIHPTNLTNKIYQIKISKQTKQNLSN